MLTESFGRARTENHSGRDKQVPAVKDCRFTQTAFGTVVHDSSGKWLGQYETEDAAVWECRNCGHIVVGTKAPEVCPVCDHPQSYFEVRAENY